MRRMQGVELERNRHARALDPQRIGERQEVVEVRRLQRHVHGINP